MDIFYTKIMIDGEGHAVSGSSDLSRLEFSEPVNLGAPINSSADDVAMLMQQNGNGGFFISNRAVSGATRHNIYRFNHEPHVFDQPGQYLVKRLSAPAPEGARGIDLTTEELLAMLKEEAPDIIRIIDTVFVEVAVEVFAGEGAEQAILQQRDIQIDQLRNDLSTLRYQLASCEAAAQTFRADAPTQPVPQPASPTEVVYRVQIAAAKNPDGFHINFRPLRNTLPNLQLETIRGADGFYRYVTAPFATFAEANTMRRRIQALGYECFVSGYRGNERVSMNVR
jgi:hypothetical protein